MLRDTKGLEGRFPQSQWGLPLGRGHKEKTDGCFPCNVSYFFFFKAVNFLPCFIHASFDQLLTVGPWKASAGFRASVFCFSGFLLISDGAGDEPGTLVTATLGGRARECARGRGGGPRAARRLPPGSAFKRQEPPRPLTCKCRPERGANRRASRGITWWRAPSARGPAGAPPRRGGVVGGALHPPGPRSPDSGGRAARPGPATPKLLEPGAEALGAAEPPVGERRRAPRPCPAPPPPRFELGVGLEPRAARGGGPASGGGECGAGSASPGQRRGGRGGPGRTAAFEGGSEGGRPAACFLEASLFRSRRAAPRRPGLGAASRGWLSGQPACGGRWRAPLGSEGLRTLRAWAACRGGRQRLLRQDENNCRLLTARKLFGTSDLWNVLILINGCPRGLPLSWERPRFLRCTGSVSAGKGPKCARKGVPAPSPHLLQIVRQSF